MFAVRRGEYNWGEAVLSRPVSKSEKDSQEAWQLARSLAVGGAGALPSSQKKDASGGLVVGASRLVCGQAQDGGGSLSS